MIALPNPFTAQRLVYIVQCCRQYDHLSPPETAALAKGYEPLPGFVPVKDA
jgi:hypothetical protein